MNSDENPDEEIPPRNETEPANAQRHGARVYLLDNGVVLVKQTVKRGEAQNASYVIDGDREQHVDPGDDSLLGARVRAALNGEL